MIAASLNIKKKITQMMMNTMNLGDVKNVTIEIPKIIKLTKMNP